MEYTKIRDNKVYFCLEEDEWKEITEIEKDDILELLKKFKLNEKFDIAEYDDAKIKNQAHNIIYKSIYEKFQELKINSDEIKDNHNNRYREILSKYKTVE